MVAGRKPTVSDREILRYFAENTDPAHTTKELADEFGLSTRGMVPRLKNLADAGYLGGKRPSNEHMWWITDEGRRFLDERES